ncbi:MAG: hypothetical protein GY906_23455 [bacterium]|nr:hypothetical protein [bacterium]
MKPTSKEKVRKCYDCLRVLPTKEERKAGARHTCKPQPRAPWDWTCTLDYTPMGMPGFLGDWTVEIMDADGKGQGGMTSDVRGCFKLAKMRGFARSRIVISDEAADKLGWPRR